MGKREDLQETCIKDIEEMLDAGPSAKSALNSIESIIGDMNDKIEQLILHSFKQTNKEQTS